MPDSSPSVSVSERLIYLGSLRHVGGSGEEGGNVDGKAG